MPYMQVVLTGLDTSRYELLRFEVHETLYFIYYFCDIIRIKLEGRYICIKKNLNFSKHNHTVKV